MVERLIDLLEKVLEKKEDINITLKTSELKEIIDYGIERAKEEIETASPKNAADNLLTRKEAAAYLGVSLPTLWRWDKAGYLKTVPYGGCVRYRMCDLERILKER